MIYIYKTFSGLMIYIYKKVVSNTPQIHRVMNVTFNNISVISWQSVLWVEETGVPRENHRPAASN
jgi:hypothetical protein